LYLLLQKQKKKTVEKEKLSCLDTEYGVASFKFFFSHHLNNKCQFQAIARNALSNIFSKVELVFGVAFFSHNL